LSARIDPGAKNANLLGFRLARFFRRHERLRLAFDLEHQSALVRFPRQEYRAALAAFCQALVCFQVQVALGTVTAMTLDAVAREKGLRVLGGGGWLLGLRGAAQRQRGIHEDPQPHGIGSKPGAGLRKRPVPARGAYATPRLER